MFFQWFNLEDPDGNQVLVFGLSNKCRKRNACLENCFQCIDAGAAKRIHHLFFCTQTIQNSGVKG